MSDMSKKVLPDAAAPLADNDEAVRALLRRWHAPALSDALDERILSAYRREISSTVAATAAQVSHDLNEVVKMKECPTCHESFADRFVFCPTDGTPLTNGFHAERAADVTGYDPDATAEAAGVMASAAASMNGSAGDSAAGREEFHLTMIQDAGIWNRLQVESREFKQDPKGYAENLADDFKAFVSRPLVALASVAAVLLVVSAIGAIMWFDRMGGLVARSGEEVQWIDPNEFPITEIPKEQPTPEKGNAGDAKGKGGGSKPKQEKPGGGGGGGRQDAPEETSFGKKPLATFQQPQVLAPKPEPPTIKNPSLPTLATVRADDVLFPPDRRPLPYGDDRSRLMTPSAGRGNGDGMGGGDGSGFGRGEGRGVGPGRGENTGGGDTRLGGGGAGGGGGGGVDYAKTFNPREVTRKAVVVSRPEPGYTEEARKNNIQGTVLISAVLHANGSVTNVRVVRGLPDGLNEKAIAAAKQIKFTPAQKDGRAVSQYQQIQYTFSIY